MSKRKILIIDANPQDRLLCKRLLSEAADALTFLECESGTEGLNQSLTASPDCILLDHQLPDVDAVEFLTQLSEVCPAPFPVVVLTSKGMESFAVRALKAGAQDYLSKHTLDRENLTRAIDNAIEKAAMRRELETRTQLLARAKAELDQRRENLEAQLQQRTAELRKANETEQELRKRAEDANRMKDEFLALLSHELRTPLNAVLGWMTIIQTERLDADQQKRALDSVHRNSIALAQLIDDLLDVSRMMTGKFAITKQDVGLNALVSNAIEAIRPQAERKAVELVSDLPAGAIRVPVDASRLQQALGNVLANAVKFTDKNGSITVRVRSTEERVAIEVVDTGIGIRQEFMPYVFDRFRQADPSTTRRHGGLGLGLAIVRHIMNLHGGVASARSAGLGKGTTITLELPLSQTSLGAYI